MKKYLHENGLSSFFLLLFLVAMVGQIFTGQADYNEALVKDGQPEVTLSAYLMSGHFIQSTFENWESEFLQMALYVVFTVSLRQKGSSESKKLEGLEEVDREPDPLKKDAPWAVRKAGWILAIYKQSLSLAFLMLFILSICLHFYGAFKDENLQLAIKGLPPVTAGEFLVEPRFWFESFQNWQSEFLSVFMVVVLSIYLRQKGSSQSKPVDAANSETGE